MGFIELTETFCSNVIIIHFIHANFHLPYRGEAFYPGVNTLGVTEHKDSDASIDRMVNDLEKQ